MRTDLKLSFDEMILAHNQIEPKYNKNFDFFVKKKFRNYLFSNS